MYNMMYNMILINIILVGGVFLLGPDYMSGLSFSLFKG